MLNEAITRQETIPDSILTAMGRRAYDDVLGNLRACHAQEPNLGTSIRFNRCITDMFWLLKTVGRPFALSDDILNALRDLQEWDEQRIGDLVDTFKVYDDGRLMLNDARIAGYLEDQGLQPSAANMLTTAQAILPYFHDAARQAHSRLVVGGSVHPLRDEPASAPPVDMAQLLRAFQAKTTSAVAVPPQPAPAPAPSAPRISDIVEQFVVHRENTLGTDSIGQVRSAAALFIFENADLRFDEVRQRHLGALVELTNRLPVTYGRTKAELEGGLAASIARGKEMKAKNNGRVGLSRTTINRHLQSWHQEHAEAN